MATATEEKNKNRRQRRAAARASAPAKPAPKPEDAVAKPTDAVLESKSVVDARAEAHKDVPAVDHVLDGLPPRAGSVRRLKVSAPQMATILTALNDPAGHCDNARESAKRIGPRHIQFSYEDHKGGGHFREVVIIPESFTLESYRVSEEE